MGCGKRDFVGWALLVSVALLKFANQCSGIDRSSFPDGFKFGFSSSAYQMEGAAHEDGRGLSIWDTFCATPGKIKNGDTGDVAVDMYHHYKEDIQILKNMGTDIFRLSISWSRVFPGGSTRNGKVNPKGVEFYNNFIDELIKNGIEPMVTLFHWDTPQVLEDEYGGFRSDRILEDYTEFADFCFKEFGDRVKKWVTINEPSIFATHGYLNGQNAPGRCTPPQCPAGDSSREPYIVSHNLLRAHMRAVKLYRSKYQKEQKGTIGISVHSDWYTSYSTQEIDVAATQRVLDNTLGLYLDPIFFGDYPLSVKEIVRERLPVFTDEESRDIKGSFDFIGMNHYVTLYVLDNSTNIVLPPEGDPKDGPLPDDPNLPDTFAIQTSFKDGVPIGPSEGGVIYWRSHPQGIMHLLNYIKEKYSNPPVYITEIGFVTLDKGQTAEELIRDEERVKYIKETLRYTLQAMREGSDLRGYMIWSYIDNFEWDGGYSNRLGLLYANYTSSNLERIPKSSAIWFANAMNKRPKKSFRPFGGSPYRSIASA
ncbi:hypothetical protein Scep_024456 [Stephania cephalantha]|uniref:Beta-glucosidase n=1 Tax=Stephania cephalantha TaxID=152367 RepID=A0AAP0HYA4_9MAGN